MRVVVYVNVYNVYNTFMLMRGDPHIRGRRSGEYSDGFIANAPRYPVDYIGVSPKIFGHVPDLIATVAPVTCPTGRLQPMK